ncbi:hypothetical protein ACGFZ7_17510 [Pseudomonas sp. NPDC047963]
MKLLHGVFLAVLVAALCGCMSNQKTRKAVSTPTEGKMVLPGNLADCVKPTNSTLSSIEYRNNVENNKACWKEYYSAKAREDYSIVKQELLKCATPSISERAPLHFYRKSPTTLKEVNSIVKDCFRTRVSTRYDSFKDEISDEVSRELHPLYIQRDEETAAVVQEEWRRQDAELKRQQQAARKRAYDNSIKSLIE